MATGRTKKNSKLLTINDITEQIIIQNQPDYRGHGAFVYSLAAVRALEEIEKEIQEKSK